jgi:hypothetical protein
MDVFRRSGSAGPLTNKDPEGELLRAFFINNRLKSRFGGQLKYMHGPEASVETLTVVAPVNTAAFLFLRLSLTTSLVSRPRVFSAAGHSGTEIFTAAIDTLAAMTGGRRRTGLTITGIRGWMTTGRFHQETVTG